MGVLDPGAGRHRGERHGKHRLRALQAGQHRGVVRQTAHPDPWARPLLVTDHAGVDYGMIARHAKLVIDTRNALAGISSRANIVKA